MEAFRRSLLAASLFAVAAPALAQEEEPQDRPEDRNSLTVGIGGAYRPSYEGSDDYTFGPIGAIFGKVEGFSFATRGTGLSIDLIRDPSDAKVTFELGPVAYVRLDRTGGMKDPQVRALGEIDTAIELGVSAGVSKKGVLHQYDSLGARLQYQKDVTDTHDSFVLTPTIEYATPLSTSTYFQLSLSMERVGDGYARTYFSITPAGAVASGLTAFNAQGGWKSRRASLFLAHALTGELRDPKLSLFAIGSYGRLRGDFAQSPIVSVAGDRDQYLALGGLSYTF
ncbi:MAG TPA: MipA/OmpV family protein [Allosphingosinicella sp.]|jgi:outer membrane scaffolding protein for murein synthesis (MipA/OmpV family)